MGRRLRRRRRVLLDLGGAEPRVSARLAGPARVLGHPGSAVEVVVPFFEAHPLVTAKQADFEAFASVLQMMQTGVHLHEDGLRRVAAVTERMNRRARSRYLESSEAIRRPTRSDVELKIWS